MSPVATPLVDDVGVEARQVQRRDGADQLQHHHGQQRPPVRPQVAAQQSDQHEGAPIEEGAGVRSGIDACVRSPSRNIETISSGGSGIGVDQARAAQRQRHEPQPTGRFGRRAAQLIAVRLEQHGEGVDHPGLGRADPPGALAVGQRVAGGEGVHEAGDPPAPLLHEPDGRDQPVGQRERPRPPGSIASTSDDGSKALATTASIRSSLRREDAEDRALRDAGGLGDQPRAHVGAVFEDERQGGRDQRVASLLGWECRGTAGHWWHRGNGTTE